jgi:hypothetical protein
MTKTIKGNLELKENTTFEESLIVEGNISGKNGVRYNLIVGGDLKCWNLDCMDLDCWNLDCWNLDCWDLDCWDLDCMNASYYAVAFAYNNMDVKSIKGRRDKCKHFTLDGKIKINPEKKK